LSLATADPANGALLMGAFGLGTLPALLATGLAARRLGTLIRQPATRRLAALAIIGFALWQLWGLRPGGMDHGDAHAEMTPGHAQASEEHADMDAGHRHDDR
jgi:sulfite exporter TauE/SafE